MKIIDNINSLLGDDLKASIYPRAKLKIAASCFSIYAYEALKSELARIESLEFLGIWEQLNNPSFNPIEFDGIKNQAGLNSFILTAKRWIDSTGAIGLTSKAGRYGGTYAHKDIAFEFASWVSVEFKLYLIYASEADLLNMALFGKTAKQWRDENPDNKGNIRDEANVSQLVCLANLENLNAHFIHQELSQAERLISPHPSSFKEEFDVYIVDENSLIACFDTGVNEDLVKELARFEPMRVVFRDTGFVSDAVKMNVEQIFKQMSPRTEVKSI